MLVTRSAVGIALLLAAISDFRSMRIPNAIPAALAALFVVSVAVGDQSPLVPHLESFAVTAAIGSALYIANVWGAGDTKLMAATALFMIPGDLGRFGLVTSLAGGVIATTALVKQRVTSGSTARLAEIPYGIALAAGGLDWCVMH
jgi:prepilin peptidase CpaA